MIDPAKVFRNTLRQWGHDILLQRRLNSEMKYSSKVEKITTRRSAPFSGSQPNAMSEDPEGLTVNAEMIYYFEAQVNPKTGDRIYENYPTGQQVFIIDEAVPVMGKFGKILYWIAGVTRESTP
jgi:hypothetical protein